MIGTVLRISLINLRRDRVAQAMTFLLPILFFSVFALVFGRSSGSTTPRVRVAVVDEDHSELSRRLVAGLEHEESLRVRTTVPAEEGAEPSPLDRDTAQSMVREGDVPVAVVLPKGLGGSPASGFFGGGEKVLILADVSDPIAPQMVNGLLQKVAMTAAPDLMASSGMEMFEEYAGPLTPQQREAVDTWLPKLKAEAAADDGQDAGTADETAPPVGEDEAASDGAGGMQGLISTETVDVMRQTTPNTSIIAFYAAGIGVMFLLFAASGAGGALIEERETGTLERLLSSRLGMGRLLAGKWLFLTLLGAAQLLVMFVWGQLVFGLDLLGHLPGFTVMTLATAGAAAAFGLVLATACRTRAQLSGISTVVILVMSAIGGSMFPRFMMPEYMQKLGLLTFNGWALDGFIKVFWRNLPILDLWPQLAVLVGITAVLLAVTRLLARRWEAA